MCLFICSSYFWFLLFFFSKLNLLPSLSFIMHHFSLGSNYLGIKTFFQNAALSEHMPSVVRDYLGRTVWKSLFVYFVLESSLYPEDAPEAVVVEHCLQNASPSFHGINWCQGFELKQSYCLTQAKIIWCCIFGWEIVRGGLISGVHHIPGHWVNICVAI